MTDYTEMGIAPEIKKFTTYITAIVVAAGSFLFHARFPGAHLLGMWLALGAAAAVGWLIGRVISHRVDGDGRGALIAAWMLTVAWLIPVVGIMLASIVTELADVARRRRYLLFGLSWLCLIASCINGAAGVAIRLQ